MGNLGGVYFVESYWLRPSAVVACVGSNVSNITNYNRKDLRLLKGIKMNNSKNWLSTELLPNGFDRCDVGDTHIVGHSSNLKTFASIVVELDEYTVRVFKEDWCKPLVPECSVVVAESPPNKKTTHKLFEFCLLALEIKVVSIENNFPLPNGVTAKYMVGDRPPVTRYAVGD